MAKKEQEQNERLRTAHHEAGHALLAINGGMTFDIVTINPKPTDDHVVAMAAKGLKQLGYISGVNRGQSFDAVVFLCAGIAGEDACTRGKAAKRYIAIADIINGGTGDWNSMVELFNNKVGQEEIAVIDSAYREARKIIRERKTEHQALTSALLERGTLTHDECCDIADEIEDAREMKEMEETGEPPWWMECEEEQAEANRITAILKQIADEAAKKDRVNK